MTEVDRPFKAAFEGAALLLLWLLLIGAGLAATGPIAWSALGIGLTAFVLAHVVWKRPSEVCVDRLARPPMRSFLMIAVPVSLVLVIGDLFWLIGQNRLDVDSEPLAWVMLVAFVTLFPLVEEFGFRLWMQTPLERRLPPLVAVLLVAALFAGLHSAASPMPQLVSGVVFGVVLIVTGSIWFSVAMHALQNFLVVVAEKVPGVSDWALELATQPPVWVEFLPWLCWGSGLIAVLGWFVQSQSRISARVVD